MNTMRKAVSALGGIFLAVLIVALAPEVARGVAALVQVTNTISNPVPMPDVDNPAHPAPTLESELDGAASTSITAPSSLSSGGAYRELLINWVTGRCLATACVTLPFTLSRSPGPPITSPSGWQHSLRPREPIKSQTRGERR